MRLQSVLITGLLYVALLSPGALASPPTKWAVLVGVDRYDSSSIPALQFSEADVRAVGPALVRYEGFPQDQVFTLTGDAAGGPTRATNLNVFRRLDSLVDRMGPDDTFLFYFSGHGFQRGTDGQFLATVNTDPTSTETLQLSAIPMPLLRRMMARVQAHTAVFIIDACRNEPEVARGVDDNIRTEEFSRDLTLVLHSVAGGGAGTAVLYSCGIGERAYDWQEKNHGAFTSFLLDGLGGAAAEPSGDLTVTSLADYIQKHMAAWSAENGKKQHPELQQSGPARIVLGHFDTKQHSAPTPVPILDPFADPVPVVIPTPTPTPVPVVIPIPPTPVVNPTPSPAPVPVVVPIPVPVPVVNPAPILDPFAEPVPVVIPTPTPVVNPEPSPVVDPVPFPTPVPTPIVNPVPAPVVNPTPGTIVVVVPTPQPADNLAHIQINTIPAGAQVILDGEAAAGKITPCTIDIDPRSEVDANAEVGVDLAGYQQIFQRVHLVAGNTTRLDWALQHPLTPTPMARILVNSDPPGASVYVDRDLYPGRVTPCEIDVDLSYQTQWSGTVSCRLGEAHGYRDVTLEPGSVVTLNIPLQLPTIFTQVERPSTPAYRYDVFLGNIGTDEEDDSPPVQVNAYDGGRGMGSPSAIYQSTPGFKPAHWITIRPHRGGSNSQNWSSWKPPHYSRPQRSFTGVPRQQSAHEPVFQNRSFGQATWSSHTNYPVSHAPRQSAPSFQAARPSGGGRQSNSRSSRQGRW